MGGTESSSQAKLINVPNRRPSNVEKEFSFDPPAKSSSSHQEFDKMGRSVNSSQANSKNAPNHRLPKVENELSFGPPARSVNSSHDLDKMGRSVNSSQAKSKNVPKPENELSLGQPEFVKEWRTMHWDNKRPEIEQKLRDFKISNSNVPYVRILVVGEVGVGKSSFINSVNNAFQHRITCEALTATGSGKSFTTTYTTHYIEGEDGSLLPFVFNDVMGLESADGVQTQDITTAVQGFMQEGYKFNPVAAISANDPGYRSNPTLEEQTFCLVNVIAADKVALMSNKVLDKLKYIREEAKKLEMPQLIIMTRPDLACPLVKEDLRKIYTSKKIKEKMQGCSNLLGIPMNYIFPVKNYHEEIDTDEDMDLLILKALEQIVNIANDTMKKKCRKARGNFE